MTQGDNTIIPTSDLGQVDNHKADIKLQNLVQLAHSPFKGNLWNSNWS